MGAGVRWLRIVVIFQGMRAGRLADWLRIVVFFVPGVEFAQEGEEEAIDGADLAADAAVAAEYGEEVAGVFELVGARVGGGKHPVMKDGGEGDGVGAMDAEVGAAGDEAGEGGMGGVVLGGALGVGDGAVFPEFGEVDFPGIEAVFEVVAGGAGDAGGGAWAGGFEGVGAVGGEAFFGDEGWGGHGYLLRLKPARWRLVDWKERAARVRSARAARKAGSSWRARQARTVRMWWSTLG